METGNVSNVYGCLLIFILILNIIGAIVLRSSDSGKFRRVKFQNRNSPYVAIIIPSIYDNVKIARQLKEELRGKYTYKEVYIYKYGIFSLSMKSMLYDLLYVINSAECSRVHIFNMAGLGETLIEPLESDSNKPITMFFWIDSSLPYKGQAPLVMALIIFLFSIFLGFLAFIPVKKERNTTIAKISERIFFENVNSSD